MGRRCARGARDTSVTVAATRSSAWMPRRKGVQPAQVTLLHEWLPPGPGSRGRGSFGLERAQEVYELGRACDDDVGCLAQGLRTLGRGDRDPHAELELSDRREGVEIGRVVAGVERAMELALLEQASHRGALVRLDRR